MISLSTYENETQFSPRRGMIAIDYALKHGRHLRGLAISGMTGSVASFLKYVNELKAQLPAEVVATMNRYEAKQDLEHPEYQRIIPRPDLEQRRWGGKIG